MDTIPKCMSICMYILFSMMNYANISVFIAGSCIFSLESDHWVQMKKNYIYHLANIHCAFTVFQELL